MGDVAKYESRVNEHTIHVLYQGMLSFCMHNYFVLLINQQVNQEAMDNAKVLLFECVWAWSFPGLVETARQYFDLNKASNLKKLRRYLQDYLACSEKYCNLKAYYLLMLGILILCRIGDVTTKQAIVNAIGSDREDIAGGLSADDRKTYDSTFNIMWNAVLFAGVYTPLFPPERVLCHDWYLIFPLVDTVSFFFP